MHVTLHVISGLATGRRIHLQTGQVGRFGRTEWSDFAFPADETLSEVHFLLQCDPAGPRLRDLQTSAGTQVNGRQVNETPLSAGDEITAGTTRFLVEIDGKGAAPTGRDGPPAADDDAGAEEPGIASDTTAAEMCGALELEDEAQALLAEDQTPEEFASLLAGRELFRDAVRFTAAWLPKRDSVLWGCRCARAFFGKDLSADDEVAVEAAQRWAIEPTEEHRREAERVAEENAQRTPGGWLATAAFWSGGSLAPPEADPVPPAEHLTAAAVAAALLMTAAQAPPLQADAVLRNFLSKANEGPLA